MTEITLTKAGKGHFWVREGLGGHKEARFPFTARAGSNSGTGSGPAEKGEEGYPPGITALTTLGTSIRPSICRHVNLSGSVSVSEQDSLGTRLAGGIFDAVLW